MTEMETNDRIIGELIGKLDQHIQTQNTFMAEMRASMVAVREEKKADHNGIYDHIREIENKHADELGQIHTELENIKSIMDNNKGFKKGFAAAIAALSGISGGGIALGIQKLLGE